MKQIVNLSSTAIRQLENITKQSNSKYILLQIKSGGCNGFSYDFKPINTINKSDEIIKFDNFNLHVCSKSILYLLGTSIDWKKDIMGEYFTFENPNANSKCGCGTSFNI